MTGASQLAVLTRPAGRNVDVMHALIRRGWAVHECPALEIHTCPVLGAQALPDPASFDLVVFVSRAAVNGYFAQLGPAFIWPASVRVGCMGPATAQAIRRACATVSSIVYPHAESARDSEALWPLLQALKTPVRKVLIVRGQDGRDWLSERLNQAGVEVLTHQAYERVDAEWSEETVTKFKQWGDASVQATWLLTRAHGITAVTQQLQRIGLMGWFRSGQFVLTHERLIQALALALEVEPGSCRTHLCQPEDTDIVLCFDQIRGLDT